MLATVDGLRTGEAVRLLVVSEQTVRAFVRARKLRATVTPLGLLMDEPDAHRLAESRQHAQPALGTASHGEISSG